MALKLSATFPATTKIFVICLPHRLLLSWERESSRARDLLPLITSKHERNFCPRPPRRHASRQRVMIGNCLAIAIANVKQRNRASIAQFGCVQKELTTHRRTGSTRCTLSTSTCHSRENFWTRTILHRCVQNFVAVC